MCTGPHTSHALVWTGSWGGCWRDKAAVHRLCVKISDLDFSDDAVMFAETLDFLLEALKVLNEELELLGLWVLSQN